jgi:hypothetical protein
VGTGECAQGIAAPRLFYAEHVGAQVGEQPRAEGAWVQTGEVKDA